MSSGKSVRSIPVALKSLLQKLNFLAQITPGVKPNISDMSVVDSGSWFGAIIRFSKGENRKALVAEIEKISEEVVDTLNSLATHKSEVFVKLIVNGIAEARLGICNLKSTYKDDPATTTRIDVILSNIDIQLEAYHKYIKGYSSDDSDDSYDRDRVKGLYRLGRTSVGQMSPPVLIPATSPPSQATSPPVLVQATSPPSQATSPPSQNISPPSQNISPAAPASMSPAHDEQSQLYAPWN